MGTQAFSAGIYSIKHFPRSILLRNTNPSSNRSFSQFFFDITCISLLLEIAQQICSFSIFSLLFCRYFCHAEYQPCFAYQLTSNGYFKVLRIGKTIRMYKKSFDEWLEGAKIRLFTKHRVSFTVFCFVKTYVLICKSLFFYDKPKIFRKSFLFESI